MCACEGAGAVDCALRASVRRAASAKQPARAKQRRGGARRGAAPAVKAAGILQQVVCVLHQQPGVKVQGERGLVAAERRCGARCGRPKTLHAAARAAARTRRSDAWRGSGGLRTPQALHPRCLASLGRPAGVARSAWHVQVGAAWRGEGGRRNMLSGIMQRAATSWDWGQQRRRSIGAAPRQAACGARSQLLPQLPAPLAAKARCM